MKNRKTDSPAAHSRARTTHEQGGDPATADAEPDADSAARPDASQAAVSRDAPPAAPRTGSHPEQVKVWEEEGGSPPERISSTKATRPRTASKAGSMGPAKD